MTVDWEDFGQLYCFYRTQQVRPPLSDIDRQTKIVLELLAEKNVRSTFFVLGMLARHRPDLVKEIARAGHEIAIHGTSHIQLTRMDRAGVERDISDSVKLVSDITGEPIHGFRAPAFSVTRDTLYVLEVLAKLGLTYDSSIFPKRLPRYGIEGFDPNPHHYALPGGGELVELPLTILSWAGTTWPVSGGGYVRLIPKPLLGSIAARATRDGRPFVLYTHPYEFDSQALDVGANAPAGTFSYPLRKALNFRWNLRRSTFLEKTRFLLSRMSFRTCKEIADDIKRSERPRLLEQAFGSVQ